MNKFGKRDFLLLIVLLIAGGVLALLVLLAPSGRRACIYVDGELVGEYALSQDTTFVMEDFGVKNEICISDGRVCVTTADCPDKLCVNMGWISREGQSIICLPHKLIITIKGDADDEIDAVVG